MKFYNLKLQIWTCPDFYLSIENFKSGRVRISITDTSGFQFFELLNLKSGHVRISNPDTSRFQFFNCKISYLDVSGILFRTCPDFNYGLQILSSYFSRITYLELYFAEIFCKFHLDKTPTFKMLQKTTFKEFQKSPSPKPYRQK